MKLSAEQLQKLKEPLPAAAVSQHPTKKYLSSIKAIYVVERLNDVFGLGGWEVENLVVKEEGKWVVVKSTFTAKEYGIVIRDIFGGNDNADMGDAYKGACTDALTKIGSYLGVGMDVYKGLNEKPETKKPVITAPAFNKAMERLKGGEAKVYQNVLDTFSLNDTQNKQLTETYRSLNGQPA